MLQYSMDFSLSKHTDFSKFNGSIISFKNKKCLHSLASVLKARSRYGLEARMHQIISQEYASDKINRKAQLVLRVSYLNGISDISQHVLGNGPILIEEAKAGFFQTCEPIDFDNMFYTLIIRADIVQLDKKKRSTLLIENNADYFKGKYVRSEFNKRTLKFSHDLLESMVIS